LREKNYPKLSDYVIRRTLDLHRLGRSLGTISKQLQIPRSPVQYKLFRCVTTLPRSGRRPKLSPSHERKLVKIEEDVGPMASLTPNIETTSSSLY
uniref:Uncharacterized protein n=1 Tax=Amphilophus citrinellus TaxID=61819 RepID=A0A3Q0QXX1_AMPCI